MTTVHEDAYTHVQIGQTLTELPFKEVFKLIQKGKNPRVLSLNLSTNSYNYVPIKSMVKFDETPHGRFLDMTFIDNSDIKSNVLCSSNSQIWTTKGFQKAIGIYNSNLVLNDAGRKCQVVRSYRTDLEGWKDDQFYDIEIMYHHNFFYDGILIR